MAITDPTTYDQAVTAIFSAPRAELGVRKQSATSRDITKPRNTAAVFLRGGRYEIHASRTEGRMKDHIWCYAASTLAHEAVDAETCRRVIELADQIAAANASRPTNV